MHIRGGQPILLDHHRGGRSNNNTFLVAEFLDSSVQLCSWASCVNFSEEEDKAGESFYVADILGTLGDRISKDLKARGCVSTSTSTNWFEFVFIHALIVVRGTRGLFNKEIPGKGVGPVPHSIILCAKSFP